MGEIATWSAVKTKVGLGKDSNECPTKAELLALSPTGTGESYIGLEISNASSYGDNETVQLSDIHKVTYKYTLALTNKTLNFTALGGAPTPAGFDLVTHKQNTWMGLLNLELFRYLITYLHILIGFILRMVLKLQKILIPRKGMGL